MKKIDKITIENHLNDLDNLIDTGWFKNDLISECVFNNKDLTLIEFVSQSREYIRQYLQLIPKSKESIDVSPCKHVKEQIVEREFYNNQKNKFSGTRIICKKCGANKFIKDQKNS